MTIIVSGLLKRWWFRGLTDSGIVLKGWFPLLIGLGLLFLRLRPGLSLMTLLSLSPVVVSNDLCGNVVCGFPSILSWIVRPFDAIFSSLPLLIVSIFDDSFKFELLGFFFF